MSNKKVGVSKGVLVILLFLWCFCGILGLKVYMLDNRLDKIDEELSNFPRKICHIEEETKKIELYGYNSGQKWYYFVTDEEEIVCESDVNYLRFYHGEVFEVNNPTDENKVCITKRLLCWVRIFSDILL